MIATASPLSASPAPGLVASLLDRAVVYVTGERACGKSTVAAALGVAGAASGRRTPVCRTLSAARTLSEVGTAGPQTPDRGDFLADDEAAGYIAVTSPEELSARAALELEAKLFAATGRGLDLIVVNGVLPDLFSDEEAEQLEVLASRPRAPWALRAALAHHRRARHHAEQLRRPREQTHTPVFTLPYLFGPALGPAEYKWLGRELMAQ
jgi:hypothetical protein